MVFQRITSVVAWITRKKSPRVTTALIIGAISALILFLMLQFEASTSDSSHTSKPLFTNWKSWSNKDSSFVSKLRDSVTFLPLKDLRFAKTAMEGHTWFMSSLNDTVEDDGGPEHIYFPSPASKHRVLCLKGRDASDGSENAYALAWPESLPSNAVLLPGLTFVSDTYYDYENLWHGLSAVAPFVAWSIANGCEKPARWLLFHWGEARYSMGSWVRNVMRATLGEAAVEDLRGPSNAPYCFERALVMRHSLGAMGRERRRRAAELMRCRARAVCGVSRPGREVDVVGEPVIRLTLLMRRGSRSFADPTAVITAFARECAAATGCLLKVAQSDDLSFCDQVKLMTKSDIVASPHGAQLTNMMFMDSDSSVMEFFPKGWLELAGVGQYAFRWMADFSGMNHTGAWHDPLGEKECPNPQHDHDCFAFYKDRQLGHNETYFAEWATSVLAQVRARKLEQRAEKSMPRTNVCAC